MCKIQTTDYNKTDKSRIFVLRRLGLIYKLNRFFEEEKSC